MSAVVSPAVGRVVEIAVAVGALVVAGDEVAVVESMKVEIPVTAAAAGVVASIAVGAGDHVQAGDVLLTLR